MRKTLTLILAVRCLGSWPRLWCQVAGAHPSGTSARPRRRKARRTSRPRRHDPGRPTPERTTTTEDNLSASGPSARRASTSLALRRGRTRRRPSLSAGGERGQFRPGSSIRATTTSMMTTRIERLRFRALRSWWDYDSGDDSSGHEEATTTDELSPGGRSAPTLRRWPPGTHCVDGGTRPRSPSRERSLEREGFATEWPPRP